MARRLIIPITAAAVAAFLAIFALETIIREHALSRLPPQDDTLLVKKSTDPFYIDFTKSFRESSMKSCSKVASARLSPTSVYFIKIAELCACAADRVLAKLTVADVRTAISGHRDDLKARFATAASDCVSNSVASGDPSR